MKAWWRHYAGSVAFVFVIILGSIGFTITENVRQGSCRIDNRTVKGLRETEHRNIESAERTLRQEKLDPGEIETLNAAVERGYFNLRSRYVYIDCDTFADWDPL